MSELQLGELLNKTEVISGLDEATAKLVVSGLQFDNRQIAAGQVFWAFSGAVTDGRKFAKAAVERGAVAVDRLDRRQTPILHFENRQPASGIEECEVRVA